MGVCSVLFALLNVLSEFITVARISYVVYCTRLTLLNWGLRIRVESFVRVSCCS